MNDMIVHSSSSGSSTSMLLTTIDSLVAGRGLDSPHILPTILFFSLSSMFVCLYRVTFD